MNGKQKIFGLGLSKTGTSSLGEALNLLGIKCVHYPYDDKTFSELSTGNYNLSIFTEIQAIVDIPAVPFYAQFDKIFPNSKFILTARDKEKWLDSCELHWKLMEDWENNFPAFKKFQDFIGAAVYGTLKFNRERFSFVYDTHVKNVCDYFKDRPQDFLIMDICAGEGWEKLCAFLDLPLREENFPHANEWMHLLMQADRDVCDTVGKNQTFILVDEQGFGKDFAKNRRALPFLEKDGIYNGAPPDDETAIGELERMRKQHNAKFIVFGWSAFWYLDYYKKFAEHLRSNFACVLENNRVIIFDLNKSIV